VFSTQEVFKIAKEAEEATAARKSRKRPQRRAISVEIEDDEESVIENVSSECGSDCIVVASTRSVENVPRLPRCLGKP